MSKPDEYVDCLSMHQPWASLVVYGIKRIEGRSWPADFRGRLWIHATSKVPEPEVVQEVEEFYRQVHALDGHVPEFPEAYPTSALLGSIDIHDCLPAESLSEHQWPDLPPSLRLEVGAEYCFLCQNPLRLLVLRQMPGSPRIWAIPRKVAKAAAQALRPPPGAADFSWAALPPPASITPAGDALAAAACHAHTQPGERPSTSSRPPTGSGRWRQPAPLPEAAAGASSSSGPAGGGGQAQEGGADEGQLPGDAGEAARQLRAAKKKLKQIQQIVEQEAAGQKLDPEQQAKARRLPAARERVAALEQHLQRLTV